MLLSNYSCSHLGYLRLLFSLSGVFGEWSISLLFRDVNLYNTEKLIKFSKSLFNFYLLILNK